MYALSPFGDLFCDLKQIGCEFEIHMHVFSIQNGLICATLIVQFIDSNMIRKSLVMTSLFVLGISRPCIYWRVGCKCLDGNLQWNNSEHSFDCHCWYAS